MHRGPSLPHLLLSPGFKAYEPTPHDQQSHTSVSATHGPLPPRLASYPCPADAKILQKDPHSSPCVDSTEELWSTNGFLPAYTAASMAQVCLLDGMFVPDLPPVLRQTWFDEARPAKLTAEIWRKIEIPAQPDLGAHYPTIVPCKRLGSLPAHRMMGNAIFACTSTSGNMPKHDQIALL